MGIVDYWSSPAGSGVVVSGVPVEDILRPSVQAHLESKYLFQHTTAM